jgi:hypothetical protein
MRAFVSDSLVDVISVIIKKNIVHEIIFGIIGFRKKENKIFKNIKI